MLSIPSNLKLPAIGAVTLVGSGILAPSPVVDAVSGQPLSGAWLSHPLGYLAFAPIGAILDQLSLLTGRQHVAVLLGVSVLFVLWRATYSRRTTPLYVGVGRECGIAISAFAGLVAFYAFGVVGTRPMVALRVSDPDVVIVDFHSHTQASHDGRAGLDVHARREWHRAAGFHVAYVTDHSSIESARLAAGSNPARAGDGTSLLVGREVYLADQNVLILGPHELPAEDDPRGEWPVLIQTIPNDLSMVPRPTSGSRGGVRGIELVDAAPRGLQQGVEERESILSIADSLNLTLVAGSNHHGWGRTAAAWNVIRIPEWRHLTPEQVGREIEAHIRQPGPNPVQVIERRRVGTRAGAEPLLVEALTLPRLAWHVLTGLTPLERLAWLGWAVLAPMANTGVRRMLRDSGAGRLGLSIPDQVTSGTDDSPGTPPQGPGPAVDPVGALAREASS